jgi:hypothetical protein
MRQANFVPQLKKVDLIGWKNSFLVRIEFKISSDVKGEIVIHITFEGPQIAFKNCNPQDK